MKNFKKIAIISLLLPLVFLFSACSFFKPLSAYDIWLQEGNTGTEADFLNWLRGDPGTPGRDSNLLYSLMEDAFEEELKKPNTTYTENDFWQFVTDSLRGDQGEPGVTDLWTASQRAAQSAVSIKAFFPKSSSRGAGVVYKKSANELYIITNYHVISNYDDTLKKLVVSTDIRVHQYGKLYFEDLGVYDALAARAEFVGGVPSYDLAIIRVVRSDGEYNPEFVGGPIVAASIPSRFDVTLGQQVIAVGNPLGEGISVTDGIVSVVSEDLIMSDLEKPKTEVAYRVIRTSAAINQGNSGGGLFDRAGRLVGIVNARTFTHSDLPVDNVGYAIPLDIVVRVAEQIITRNGAYLHPVLGIQIIDSGWTFRVATADEVARGERLAGEIYTYEKVTLEEFTYDTHAAVDAADTTGFMKGDVFLSMSYGVNYGLNRNPVHKITRVYQIREYMIDCYDINTITFVVLRGGQEKTITIDMRKQHPEI